MRKFTAIFLLTIRPALFLFFLVLSRPARAATINAASCSQANVQTAVTAAASGDTVVVPACSAGSVTWASQVNISGKALTLQGGGIGVTNINVSNAGGALGINGSATNFVRVTGFTFNYTGATTSEAMIGIDGTNFQVGIRFDHNRLIINGNTARGIEPTSLYGVIDHNTFDVGTTSSVQMISPTGTPISNDGGFLAWQQPLNQETINSLYIEDNVFNYPTAGSAEDAIDGYSGARVVIRHNTFNNAHIGWHGTDTGGNRGPVYYDVYNNAFINNTAGQLRAGTIRGGTGVWHDNTFTGSFGSITLMTYRQAGCGLDHGWGDCNGTQYRLGDANVPPFSSNASRTTTTGAGANACSTNREFFGSSATCAANSAGTNTAFFDGASGNGYPCRDQPGVGPPNQTVTPLYEWNNGSINFSTFDGGGGTCTLPQSTYMASGRDYFNDTVKPGYTDFTYPHPLQGITPPAPDITTTSLPGGGLSVAYSQTLGVTGGTSPFTWIKLTGTLPTGISISTGGVVSGTPSVAGTFNFTVQVTDGTSLTDTQALSIDVTSPVTRYVNNTGTPACSNTAGQSGAIGAPFCDIDYGLTRIIGGDTLTVVPSATDYDNGATKSGPSGATSSSRTTLICSTPGGCQVSSGNPVGGQWGFNAISHFVIDGFHLNTINQAIFCSTCIDVIIRNNTIENVGQEGIHVRVNSANVLVQNNIIHNTGTNTASDGECIYVGTGSGAADNTNNVTVIGNTVYNCGSEGIEIKPGTHDNIVDGNNVGASNTTGLSNSFGGSSIEIDPSSDGSNQNWPSNPNHIIRNNVCHDPGPGGASTLLNSCIHVGTGATVYNNVIYGMRATVGNCIFTDNQVGDSYTRKIYHNTCNNTTARAIVNSGGTVDIRNNIGSALANNLAFSSAYFVNSASNDYHLLGGAAAINAGVDLTATVPTAIDGTSRTQYAPPDLGAYEFSVNRRVGGSHKIGGGRTVH